MSGVANRVGRSIVVVLMGFSNWGVLFLETLDKTGFTNWCRLPIRRALLALASEDWAYRICRALGFRV